MIKAGLALFWARLGSLNSLAQTREAALWRRWLGTALPSADTMGRAFTLLDCAGLRQGIAQVYTRLKRNKALPPLEGFATAVLDGHETHNSYRRHCEGCLKRTIKVGASERVQYYHRNVTLMLLSEPLRLLLDLEPQRPGEDEVAAALRLLERVLWRYPRAFELVLADGLYAGAPFINFLIDHGKHALVVLKDERRDIYQDAGGLFRERAPLKGSFRSRECQWWDEENLSSWPQVKVLMRVVRSQETWTVRRQATGQVEELTSEWIWATTLPQRRAGVATIVRLGHKRWDIENFGFNELVNDWHADHVYRHDQTAIEAFILLAFLAYNLFSAWLWRNLKPAKRQSKTHEYWARVCSAVLHQAEIEEGKSRSP